MRAPAVAVLILLSTAACDVRVGDEGVSLGVTSGKAEDEWVRTYALAEGARLELLNVNGPITVSGTQGPDVHVRILRESRGRSDEAAQAALESVEILEESDDGRVAVLARPRPRSEDAEPPRRQNVSVRFEVQVPSGLVTSLRTQNGPILASQVSGRIEAEASNGSVTATGLSGGMTASVGNGSIRIDFDRLTEPSTAVVINGRVQVALPADARANVTASAVNGRISFNDQFGTGGDGSRGLRHQADGRVTGSLNGGGPELVLQTTNGAILIEVLSAGGTASR